MRYAIVYSSQTGNTALLARRIKAALIPHGCVCCTETGAKIPEADLLFIGFWTDKGTCDVRTASFLARLSSRRVFLFGTAGFGGNDAYFQQILSRVRAQIPETNEVVGAFMCQGRMPSSVRARYEKQLASSPTPEPYKALIENYDLARAHPDEEDLRRLEAAVCPFC